MTAFYVREIDDAAVSAFRDELAASLRADDRPGLASLCGGPEDVIAAWSRPLVELYLVAPSYEPASSLRGAIATAARARVVKRSIAIDSKVVDELARNVASDAKERVATLLLRLLDDARTPFFLRDPGKSLGAMTKAERDELVREIRGVDIGALDELIDALGKLELGALLERA